MVLPRVNGFISNSNYYSLDGSNENLTLFGGNVSLGKSSSLSLSAGADWNVDSDGNSKLNPAFEAKFRQNIGENFNTQVRFREIGGSEQYRVTFGGSYSFDKNNSIYAATHFTSKNNNGDWNHKTGGWIGYTHKFNNGVSVSGEIQQNINIGKHNNLDAFDGNKLFNVMVSIPLNK